MYSSGNRPSSYMCVELPSIVYIHRHVQDGIYCQADLQSVPNFQLEHGWSQLGQKVQEDRDLTLLTIWRQSHTSRTVHKLKPQYVTKPVYIYYKLSKLQ